MNELTSEEQNELGIYVNSIIKDRSYLVERLIEANKKIRMLENTLAVFIMIPVASIIVYLFFGG